MRIYESVLDHELVVIVQNRFSHIFRDIANSSYLKLPMHYIFSDIDGTLQKHVGKILNIFIQVSLLTRIHFLSIAI